jgi:hypothetical protein
LYQAPHHSPESYGLDFATFVRQPWRAFYGEPGLEFSPSKTVRMKLVREKNLLESYSSVLAMRESSIHTFESFKHRFQHVMYLNLESLEQDPEGHLRALANQYNLTMRPAFQDVRTYKGGDQPFVKNTYAPVAIDDLLYLLKTIVWQQEKEIGYVPKVGAKIMAIDKQMGREPEQLLRFTGRDRAYFRGEAL